MKSFVHSAHFALVLLLCLHGTVQALSLDDASALDLTTDKVVAFKDGYALFIRSGEATCDAQGRVYTEEVPDAAVLGSFWATTPEGPPISMRAGYHTSTSTNRISTPCTGSVDILRANRGRQATVEMQSGRTYTGTIVDALTHETDASVPFSGSHFVLSAADGDLLLPIASIGKLTIGDMRMTLEREVPQVERKKRLTLDFNSPGEKKRVTLMYFRPGVRWIPTYRVSLPPEDAAGPARATMTLQAEILNEAEELADVPLDIVVGVPNFRFRTVVSPFSLERMLRNTLREAAPQVMGQQMQNFSNALFTQRAGETMRYDPAPAAGDGGGEVTLPSELTTAGAQDLFIYSLPKISLGVGERMAVHILEAEVPYRDVYTWDLHVKREDIATAPSGAGQPSPLQLSQNQVWHQIELTNTSRLPWTTGAAMFMQGTLPLAQELLTYTSPGGVVRVPLTVAVDARGHMSESEVERALQSLTWDGHHYAKIVNEARLALTNSKSIPIDAEITLRFGGKSDAVSDEGVATILAYRGEDWERYRGSPAVNNSTRVLWRQTIDPGQSFTPTVTYHYFARQ